MALYAFDGTWNEAKQGEDPQYSNTNVARFFAAYHRNSGTDDFYVAGVGTRYDVIGAALGGAFGLGVLARLLEAYDHLCRSWIAGDTAIDVVGFSRGAATTLDFCNHLLKQGVRRPGTGELIEPKPRIRFLGVWDVVAAFGLANLGNTLLNIGHNLSLPSSGLQYCFHAMALDERRPSFLPTRLPGACEVWFRGVHSDIGGGNGNRGLNDIALKWMMSKAKAASLPITDADIAALQPDAASQPKLDRLPLELRLVSAVDRRHYTVSPVHGGTMPPATCSIETATDEQHATEVGASGIVVLTPEARARIAELWQIAETIARDNEFKLDQVRDALLTLLQGRIALVTNDAQMAAARQAVARLMAVAVHGAQERGFHVLSEFFFNEALFKLPRMFPLTD
jgi:type VI secretion system (T6SS) phospholipase Tle1-like effector